MTAPRLTQPIHDAITAFVRYATEPGEKHAHEFLVICDLLLASHHHSPDLHDERDLPEPPDIDYLAVQAEVAKCFPNYGLYNVPQYTLTKIAESPVMVGDAIEDIAEVVRDFRHILWRYDHTSEADAVWYFRWGYGGHWGRHVRDLQYYLIRLEDGD